MSGTGMTDHTGRLVRCQDILIFIEDLERVVL
jgi:hypothetical protein